MTGILKPSRYISQIAELVLAFIPLELTMVKTTLISQVQSMISAILFAYISVILYHLGYTMQMIEKDHLFIRVIIMFIATPKRHVKIM